MLQQHFRLKKEACHHRSLLLFHQLFLQPGQDTAVGEDALYVVTIVVGLELRAHALIAMVTLQGFSNVLVNSYAISLKLLGSGKRTNEKGNPNPLFCLGPELALQIILSFVNRA
jgi:hypothetical protein